MQWKNLFENKYLRNEFIITLVISSLVLFAFANFLRFNEGRYGTELADPLLWLFSPVDLTWLTFILIYFSLVIAVIELIKSPDRLVFTIQAYILLLLLRMAMMFLMPLNPPAEMIPLNDPFVQNFSSGSILTKDLFFSGHTATIFLLFLTSRGRFFKIFFFTGTILVGACLLLQHVHYTIDVISAPFFSYLCYRFTFLIHKTFLFEGKKYERVL